MSAHAKKGIAGGRPDLFKNLLFCFQFFALSGNAIDAKGAEDGNQKIYNAEKIEVIVIAAYLDDKQKQIIGAHV